MVVVDAHPQGAVFTVRASPGARRNAVTGEHAGMLKVSVTQAPEKGKANQAIVEVLCDALNVKRSQIEQLSGLTSQEKKFLVRDVTAEALAERLAGLLDAER